MNLSKVAKRAILSIVAVIVLMFAVVCGTGKVEAATTFTESLSIPGDSGSAKATKQPNPYGGMTIVDKPVWVTSVTNSPAGLYISADKNTGVSTRTGTVVVKDAYGSQYKYTVSQAPHTHQYSWVYAVNPTCTSTGRSDYRCSVCGNVASTNTLGKIAHTYAYQKTVAATCTKEGYDVYKCKNCSATENRNKKAALGHKTAIKRDVEPTCTSTGHQYEYCTRSGCTYKTSGSSLPKIAHNYQKQKTVSATCTSGGYDVYKCKNCSATENRNKTSALGHKTAIKRDVEPTCTSTGHEYEYCTRSGCTYKTAGATLAKIGHKYEKQKTVAPTCTAEGYDLYKCKNCTATEKRNKKSALGHSTAVKRDVEPTCTSLGHQYEYCTRSGCTYKTAGSSLAKIAHDYQKQKTVAATCTAKGYDLYKCKNCTATEKRNEKSALGHSYTKKVTTKAPTCTEDGLGTYKCANCDSTSGEFTILAAGHTEVFSQKPASYTEAGYKRTECSKCKKVLTNETISKLQITLKFFDGSSQPIETKKVYYGDKYSFPKVSSKGDDWQFLGWFKGTNGGSEVRSTDYVLDKTPTIEIYTHWLRRVEAISSQKERFWIFDGIFEPDSWGMFITSDKWNPHSEVLPSWITSEPSFGMSGVDISVTCEKNTSTSSRYTLLYVYDKNTANARLYKLSQEAAKTYKYEYDANGGNKAPETQTKIEGVDLQLQGGKPSKPGYKFAGWITDDGDKYQPNNWCDKDANITLHAVWQPYKISFDENGGHWAEGKAPTPIDWDCLGGIIPSTECYIPSRENYTFFGWNTKKDGSGEFYIPNGLDSILDYCGEPKGDIMLFAMWNPNSITASDGEGYIYSYDGYILPGKPVKVPIDIPEEYYGYYRLEKTVSIQSVENYGDITYYITTANEIPAFDPVLVNWNSKEYHFLDTQSEKYYLKIQNKSDFPKKVSASIKSENYNQQGFGPDSSFVFARLEGPSMATTIGSTGTMSPNPINGRGCDIIQWDVFLCPRDVEESLSMYHFHTQMELESKCFTNLVSYFWDEGIFDIAKDLTDDGIVTLMSEAFALTTPQGFLLGAAANVSKDLTEQIADFFRSTYTLENWFTQQVGITDNHSDQVKIMFALDENNNVYAYETSKPDNKVNLADYTILERDIEKIRAYLIEKKKNREKPEEEISYQDYDFHATGHEPYGVQFSIVRGGICPNSPTDIILTDENMNLQTWDAWKMGERSITFRPGLLGDLAEYKGEGDLSMHFLRAMQGLNRPVPARPGDLEKWNKLSVPKVLLD